MLQILSVFWIGLGGCLGSKMTFDTLLEMIIAALLPLFSMIDMNIGQAIRRSLKLTQIPGFAEILPAFLKCLFLRVRQKVRQFAVDTELLVTCKPTCKPLVTLV